MKKLILQQFVTIDGYAAATNGDMDFIQEYAAKNDKSYQEDATRFLDSVGTMILGRNTYTLFSEYWPFAESEVGEFAEKLNSLSKYVVSTTLKEAPWGDLEGAEIINESPADKIAGLKQGSGKDIVVWGSLKLATLLAKRSLIDEYQLRVCPYMMGAGKSLFTDELGMPEVKLMEAKKYDAGMVFLRYQPKSHSK